VANLALMLPSVPKSFGRLSDAYLSAFLACLGKVNPLFLPSKQSYGVILIDGLGVSNIKNAGAHAGYLNKKLSASKTLFSGFPSTTATSLASFATGKQNGEHSFIGYRVFDKETQTPINLLNELGDSLPPRKYQDLETVSELASAAGLRVVTIGPAEYAQSGFTKATMPAAQYLPAPSIEDRFKALLSELGKEKTLAYLYVPELDQLAHRFGSNSQQWFAMVEQLDSEVAKFSEKLPKVAGSILTADHGVIDVPRESHVYLDEFDAMEDVIMVGGDPRVGFLYFNQGVDLQAKRQALLEQLNGLAEIVSSEELVDSGWIAPLSKNARRVAPDLIVLPKFDRVVYDRRFAKKKSMEMVGQHGGMNKQEWEVPLLVF